MSGKITKYCGILLIVLSGLYVQTLFASENIDKTQKIDAKEIIETTCVECHNINCIVHSPDRSVGELVQIISFANRAEHFITKVEMIAVIKWLKAHRNELEPAPIDYDEMLKDFDPEMGLFLKENKCFVCHTGKVIKQKIDLLDQDEWKNIMTRMQKKGPDLLKGLDADGAAKYFTDIHSSMPYDATDSTEEMKDKKKQ